MWGVYSGYLGSENFYIFPKGSVMNIDCIYSLSLPLYLKIVHITNTQILTIRVLPLPLPSCFSRVQLCATPRTAAHQAPPSLGFSRQEHWSGLPFPSPMHESEKWKLSRSVVSELATPWTTAYQAPPSMGFSRQEYWSGVPLPSPKGKSSSHQKFQL